MGLRSRQRKRRKPGEPWGSLSCRRGKPEFGETTLTLPRRQPGRIRGHPEYLEAALGDLVLAAAVAVGEVHRGPGRSLAEGPWGQVADPALALRLRGQAGAAPPLMPPHRHPAPPQGPRSLVAFPARTGGCSKG